MQSRGSCWLAVAGVSVLLLGGCGGETASKGAVLGCAEADLVVFYSDADGDGYGDAARAETACALPEGGVVESGDCDDADAAVHPGAAETCNGVDDNCDGEVDVDAADTIIGYRDADGDGFGDPETAAARCALLADEVGAAGDCDDADPETNPDGEDLCGEQDRSCDGVVEACPDESWTRDDADVAWTGQGAHDATGVSLAAVAGAGGHALLLGAPDFDHTAGDNHGAVYVATGSAGGALADGGWLVGAAAGDRFGTVVAELGVVDASGDDVVAISAPEAEVDGQAGAGVVYLFSSLPVPGDGPIPAGAADGLLVGPAAFVGAGTAVLPAGDMNGDGFADVLVAAARSDGSGERRGEVWLVLGSPAGLSGQHDLDDFPRWEGAADHDGLGQGIAAGDFDGDGLPDVGFGAPTYDREGKGDERIGGVWVVDGREPELPATNALDDAEAFIEGVIGEDETWFGAAMLSPGDLDGDGYDELAVGGPWYDQEEDGPEAGAVWVFSGSLDGLPTTTAASAELTVLGEASWDWFGGSLAAVPDLDGDGSPELLVGADAADPGGTVNGGAVYLVPGSLGDGVVEAAELEVQITGTATGDRVGRAMAAGDVDGDGATDLLIGAPGAEGTGGAFAFLGVGLVE